MRSRFSVQRMGKKTKPELQNELLSLMMRFFLDGEKNEFPLGWKKSSSSAKGVMALANAKLLYTHGIFLHPSLP